MMLLDRNVRIVEEGIDVAVRIGPLVGVAPRLTIKMIDGTIAAAEAGGLANVLSYRSAEAKRQVLGRR